MYLLTYHGTILAFDGSQLIQTSVIDERAIEFFSVAKNNLPANFKAITHGDEIAIQSEGKFASAIPKTGRIDVNRDRISRWEMFLPIEAGSLAAFAQAVSSPDKEHKRFARRVLHLVEIGAPVRIYAGSGPVPKPGFLNLDRQIYSRTFFRSHPDDYFIFPFVAPWDIPDNSVDYIFDENFFEHISQTMQWQYLAETLRVLKPGCWHRISTPNILTAMKRHSNFKKGFAGVYTGEERWGHVAMVSPFQLKEMAETVGYRETVFTTKSHGVSPFAVEDCRPGGDRDQITGNVHADLLK